MKCKSCGAEIAESNKFCGICGAPNITSGEAQNDRIGENTAAESKDYQIDDILNSYSGKSEEEIKSKEVSEITSENSREETAEKEIETVGSTDGNIQLSNNAEQERTADSSDKKESGGFSYQNKNIQQNYQGGNPQYNPNNMPYGNYPPNNQNGYYGSNMNGYPQNPAFVPYNQDNQDNDKNEDGKKGKRVVSLGIAVFSIIVALIMSAFCGFLLETCIRNNINPFTAAKTSSIVQNTNSQDIL